MAAYAAARRRAGRSDRSLHCCRPAGSLPRGTWPARPRRGATRGAGGNGAAGGGTRNRRGTRCSLPSWGAVMSRAGGEIDRFREEGFPVHPSPPPPSRGSPAVAARRRRRQGGGDPNNVPQRRRATAVANAVAFFAMMDAFIRWRGGYCFDNGGGDVFFFAKSFLCMGLYVKYTVVHTVVFFSNTSGVKEPLTKLVR